MLVDNFFDTTFNLDSEKHVDIVEELIRYFEENIPNLFKKKKDIEIAYAIIELFKRKIKEGELRHLEVGL